MINTAIDDKLDISNEVIESCLMSMQLSESEQIVINRIYDTKLLKKGSILLKEGQLANHCYHVLDGCIRQYQLLDGEEKTTYFYTADQSIFAAAESSKNKLANYYLECVVDTHLTFASSEDESQLFKRFPRFESLCRKSMEQKFNEFQATFSKFITSSPEERYLDLMENRPDLITMVPQYQLASFLGVTPESLSRIRKRISLKGA